LQGLQGLQGLVGPSGVASISSAGLLGTALNGVVRQIPSSLTMSVSDPSVTAVIHAEGDVQLTGAAWSSAIVELELLVDGAVVRTLRTSVVNSAIGNHSTGWHIHGISGLSAGSHTFVVQARVLASSGATTVLVNSTQGLLSAVLLKQ
jgi:hypothetical protein